MTLTQKFKENALGIFKRSLYMLPFVLLSFFLLITISSFFGSDQAILGILFLFFTLMNMQNTFSIGGYWKSGIILFVVSILATIATLNTATSIILNFLVPFLLVMLLSDELSPKRYFIYGLFFVLLQNTFPVTLSILPNRMIAMVYGLVVVFIFNLIINKLNKKNIYSSLIQSGFSTLSKRVKLLAKNRLSEQTHNPLFNITNKLSIKLYNDAHEKTGTLNAKEDCYFQFILLLEEIDQLTNTIYKENTVLEENDQKFYHELGHIFALIGEGYAKSDNKQLLEQIDNFVKNYSLSNEKLDFDWKYIIDKLKNVLTHYLNPQKETNLKDAFKLKKVQLKRSFSFKSSHLRFAIRVSLVIGFGFIIAHLIPVTNTYWLPITAYTTMFPFFEDELKKMSSNIVGAVLGAICFIGIFQFIPSEPFSMLFMFFALLMIFSLSSDVLKTVMGTQLALVLNSSISNKIFLMDLRISLVVVAIILTYVIDKFILHTNHYDGLKHKIHELIYKNKMIVKELRKSLIGNTNSRYLDELLLESYLIENEIIVHAKKTKKEISNLQNIYDLVDYNKNFLLSSEKLINLLNEKDVTKKDKKLIDLSLDEISLLIKALENQELNSMHLTVRQKEPYYEDYHLKRNIVQCKESMIKLYQTLTHKNK